MCDDTEWDEKKKKKNRSKYIPARTYLAMCLFYSKLKIRKEEENIPRTKASLLGVPVTGPVTYIYLSVRVLLYYVVSIHLPILLPTNYWCTYY